MQELNDEKGTSRGVGALNKLAHEATRRKMLQLQLTGPMHTLYVAPYWYVALAGRGLQLAPNIDLLDSYFDTEEEAVAAGQHKVQKWKQQLSCLEPAT